ncbi:unnamed protein product [Durusdinium trenchii]|uniref:Glucose-methanol-choline oxidoreductase N-terminal domain-containing protein n=3 Tax=Durusdinium trenchii TaxID=1381693 RepID=A0ABP0KY52_9DINO
MNPFTMLSKRLARSTFRKFSTSSEGSYDYIIVGAGSAGATIAHRLVKDAGARVLLIENGSSHYGRWDWWKINMPAALTYNLADAKYNWDFYTVPQRHMDGRRLHQPRGRALGGSSSLNAMAYVRGHALDYERWAKEIGEGGEAWSYRSILPYYRKAQTHQEGESTYRGGSGPLAVTRRRSRAVQAINDAFVRAGEEAGYPRTADMNGFQQEGFGAMDMTVTPDGKRASTWECYLKPLVHPKSPEEEAAGKRLKLITNEMAVRLLFDKTKVVGVETIPAPTPKKGGGFHSETSGRTEKHFAKTEVILSAGAVGSPQLLMMSGIGNAKDLESLGVPVLLDQPSVGANLQDHLEFYVQYLSKLPCSLYPWAATFPGLGLLSKYAYRQPWRAIHSGILWMLAGRGMGSSNHFEVGGFIRSREGMLHPDLQFHFIPGIVTGQLDFLPEHGYQAHCGTMRPTSRGTVQLATSNILDAPLIDPNFLATEEDRIDMRAGLRLSIEIMEQKALEEFKKERHAPLENINLDSDEEVDAWIRSSSHSGYHLSCTCAMGKVVDAEGRVKGLENLRIADASIMPSMTSGNLNAPTIMMAELIADRIRGETPLPPEDAAWYQPPDWQTSQR